MGDAGSALITGGGSGIGKHLSLILAKRGCKVTVADLDLASAQNVVDEARKTGGLAQAVRCDVSCQQQQEQMFDAHMQAYGRLDTAVLNAGIGETDLLAEPEQRAGSFLDKGNQSWQKVLQVDLWAVCVGAQLAAHHMAQHSTQGLIIVNASAGGLYPMPYTPIYGTAKAGCVQLVRSLAQPLARKGIRIGAVCPEFTNTPLVEPIINPKGGGGRNMATMREAAQHLLTVEEVCQGFTFLMDNPAENGTVLMLVGKNRKAYRWHPPKTSLTHVDISPPSGAADTSRQRAAYAAWAALGDTSSNPCILVHRLSNRFREVTRVESRPLPDPIPDGHILVRHAWAGVNASDVNFTSGRYFGTKEATRRLPFPAGFEAVGVVAALGPGVSGLQVGDAVAHLTFGSFASWGMVKAQTALPCKRAEAPMLVLLTSGLTASIGLQVCGQISRGETVLITAAAGGTGQIAVQVAKAAKCHVIALCSSDSKAAMLKQLGADRVVDYKREDLGVILRKEYPKGVDVVWETVGGTMFDTCARNLAVGGRLLVIGMMSQYGEGWPASQVTGLPEVLLNKSASVRGFFVTSHAKHFKSHFSRLLSQWESGELKITLDSKQFRGLESVADAVEHLHSGSSMGKVVVQVAPDLPPAAISSL